VRDATASFSPEEMRAALDINLPNYVNASEITEAISARPGSPLIHAVR